MTAALYELGDVPPLDEPFLLLALDGLGDGGLAVSATAAHLRESVDPSVVATFDAEELLDYRARRPLMQIVDGVVTAITWPDVELLHGHDLDGRDLLVLTGPEPDARWRDFASAVADLATRLGVTTAAGLGAFPAPVPHTRRGRIGTSAATPELANRVGERHSTLDVSAGVQSVVELALHEAGIPSIGLWAQVPHYAAGAAFPGAAVNLLDAVTALGGLRLDLDRLREADAQVRARLDELVADDPDHRAMLAQLEAHYDANVSSVPGREASAEDLVDELEDWLRRMGTGSDPDSA